MIVCVSGSRFRSPGRRELAAFLRLWNARGYRILREGGARGTDTALRLRAEVRGTAVQSYPVDTELDGEWPAAGPRRNRRMILGTASDGPAHELAAFWGERGTANAVRTALGLGRPVFGWNWRLGLFTPIVRAAEWEELCLSDESRIAEAIEGKREESCYRRKQALTEL